MMKVVDSDKTKNSLASIFHGGLEDLIIMPLMLDESYVEVL